MKTAVQENELAHRLDIFLNNQTTAKDLALCLRRFQHECIKTYLISENTETISKGVIEDGYFWITELCEILDPHLKTKEQIDAEIHNRE